MRLKLTVLLLTLILRFSTYAQTKIIDSTSISVTQKQVSTPDGVSEKSLLFVSEKYNRLTNSIDSQTVKMLQRMQRKEAKLQKKLYCIDSNKASTLFNGTQAQYQQLQASLRSPITNTSVQNLKQYLPLVDSIGTLMNFLSANKNVLPEKLAQIQNISTEMGQLQGRMDQALATQNYLQARAQQLKDQLSQYSSLASQLTGVNKQVYYYQAEITQYKELINDKTKLEEAVLNKVRELPAFQNFMKKYSILAQVFPSSQDPVTSITSAAGLQTRSLVLNALAQRLPTSSASDPSQYLQQQIQQQGSPISSIKDKINQFGSSGGGDVDGGSDMTTPDFTPNSQHTKSFFKRLEYGYNFQTASSTSLLPSICTIGLSLGYKLSDKATIGTGVSYMLGIGRGFNDIAFTNQGIGLRSYADAKVKGSVWVTGGFEYNYMQSFQKFSGLPNIDVWQKSALLGITKKYKVGNKQGNMQLLYDFLASNEIPRGQPFKFRIGYSF